jgi:hypothetical protein
MTCFFLVIFLPAKTDPTLILLKFRHFVIINKQKIPETDGIYLRQYPGISLRLSQAFLGLMIYF